MGMLQTDRFSVCYPVSCAIWQLSKCSESRQLFTVQVLQTMVERLWVGNTGPKVWLKLAQAVRSCVARHHSQRLLEEDTSEFLVSLRMALVANLGECLQNMVRFTA